MVQVVHTVAELRTACDAVRAKGGRVGLVPTMGALHEGHVALVEQAARRTSQVVVTVFVNPTQFGPNEDFDKYPRTLDADVAASAAAGASLVFAPAITEMYPPGERTRVIVSGLTEHLCGRSRPGHFEGVATVVTKLFAAVGPCVAVFGRKDYQQLKVIERMARDLLLPVEIVGHPTVREADGLAKSSRNAYLSKEDRERARAIPQALAHAVQRFGAGERRSSAIGEDVRARLTQAGLRIDYVTLADPETIAPIEGASEARALLAVAAFAGATRLIDNVVLGEDPAPVGVS
ncbi:MAG: pantoate--beta-alanine ligase [Polyangiaceae bacterium]|nr:pantoate--beta-alanine ligase [Polyangiaceae bacterium]